MPRGQVTWITYEGETRSMTAWARHWGLPQKTLWKRLTKGWPVHEAFTTPLHGPRLSHGPRPSPWMSTPMGTGLAPHIAGPAIAVGGQWVPLDVWVTQRR